MPSIIEQAVEAHKAGKLEEAEALYRTILKNQPKHPDANHNLGFLAASINKTAMALPFFKVALEANPNQEQYWISYIDALLKEKQIESARSVLDHGKKMGLAGEKVDELSRRLAPLSEQSEVGKTQSLTFTQQRKKFSAKKEKKKNASSPLRSPGQNDGPSQVEINALLAQYESGQYEAAEKLAVAMTQRHANHQFGWKVLGAVFRTSGRLPDAVVANQKAVALVPNDVEAHSNLGNALKDLGRPEEAEASYRQAIAFKPDFAEVHSSLGNALKDLGRLEEAEASYRQAIAFKPDFAEAHSNLGAALNALGRLEEAEISHRQAIAFKPDYAEAHSNLGAALQDLGRLEEAEASYRQAIALKPDFAQVHSNLGHALNQLGRLDEAEASHRQAIAFKPDFAEAHSNLGNALKDLGRPEEAEASYRQAIAFKPDFAEVHSNLGNALKDLGRLEEAEASYRQAIAFKPDFAEAHSNLGAALNDLGRLGEAEISHRQAIAFKPDYAEAHSNLGNALKDLGRLEEAEASYRQAIALKPDFARALSNFSLLCMFLNRQEDSKEYLKKVMKIDTGVFGLKAAVNLAILSFLDSDLDQARLLINNAQSILKNKSKLLKNEVIYYIYLNRLLNWRKENNGHFNGQFGLIINVIGESHSLSSHGIQIQHLNEDFLCKAHWIAGCKQWHLGNSHSNQYKEKFKRIVQSLPDRVKILMSIGEIDCRLDEGLLKHLKEYPEKTQSTLIQSTVENYLTYVYKITKPKLIHVIIQGIPCPNIDPDKVEINDLSKLINLIKEFNAVLSEKSTKIGFEFLDLHKLTDKGDGFSNGLWNIDAHHLSPTGMLEAWRRHLA